MKSEYSRRSDNVNDWGNQPINPLFMLHELFNRLVSEDIENNNDISKEEELARQRQAGIAYLRSGDNPEKIEKNFEDVKELALENRSLQYRVLSAAEAAGNDWLVEQLEKMWDKQNPNERVQRISPNVSDTNALSSVAATEGFLGDTRAWREELKRMLETPENQEFVHFLENEYQFGESLMDSVQAGGIVVHNFRFGGNGFQELKEGFFTALHPEYGEMLEEDRIRRDQELAATAERERPSVTMTSTGALLVP